MKNTNKKVQEAKTDVIVQIIDWFDADHNPTDKDITFLGARISKKYGIKPELVRGFMVETLEGFQSSDESSLEELAEQHPVHQDEMDQAEFFVVAQAFNELPTGLIWSIRGKDKDTFTLEIDSPGQQLIFTPLDSKLKLDRCISTIKKLTGGMAVHKNFINKYKESK